MFNNIGDDLPGDSAGEGGGNRPLGNFQLTRQPSIYSLTFEEFQNTMGGCLGNDFGSMNMDELLKKIWTAEETQSMTMTSTSSAGQDGQQLQRQGSLTLPRTLSQKAVDEVWRDIAKDCGVGKDGNAAVGANYPQRQQTLGETTLEEFLVRAGVVREDIQMGGKVGSGVFFGDLSRTVNENSEYGIALQQMGRGTGLTGNRTSESNNNGSSSNNQVSMQSSNLPLNVHGVRLNQNQLSEAQVSHQQQPQKPQIFPKQPAVGGYMTQMHIESGLASPGIRGGIVGLGDQGMNGTGLQGGGMGRMMGLGVGVGVGALSSPSNQLSSDVVGKSNDDSSSVSPVPYVFNGGLRGRRRNGDVEKVIERRQKRMIKNRESAARSRARKQAYTMELEAEIAKLKEENQELQKKQASIMEMQKHQVLHFFPLGILLTV
ncbi:Abscisic acid responsive elements-binding factor 2 isoform 1 [Tripterygium wilfordii]|uniref:Abscisic acid responsive elements-binding factor 2 isoform 1 n=1 Tax=Tripterygium wilfordii TaxID=458696 RepID=A0A7J7DKW1_TRIWF|nr:Abscisic acid responsive elements-binding factor 2 isoform 1 [Tripterygium wilfordii]